MPTIRTQLDSETQRRLADLAFQLSVVDASSDYVPECIIDGRRTTIVTVYRRVQFGPVSRIVERTLIVSRSASLTDSEWASLDARAHAVPVHPSLTTNTTGA